MNSSRVVFVRTQRHEPTYDDFWRLATLAGYGVVDARRVDLKRLKDTVLITVQWDALQQLRVQRETTEDVSNRIVWWCLDRSLADITRSERRKQLQKLDGIADEVWVSDRRYASLDPMFRHIVLGGHRSLMETRQRFRWDVALYGQVQGRRADVEQQLHSLGMRVTPPAWTPTDRDDTLGQTKTMLHVHANAGMRLLPPLRVAVAASYGMALVAEAIDDPFPLVQGVDFVSGPDVATLTRRLVTGDPSLPAMNLIAENLHELLVEDLAFDVNVNAAAEAILSQRTN